MIRRISQDRFRNICFLVPIFSIFLTGCISTSVDQKYSAEGFSWDTLKRDQIVMFPFQDLREGVDANDPNLTFFDAKKSTEYAEAFKQVFFKLRKDIRLFGAGGAFEALEKIPNLQQKAKLIASKQPLSEQDLGEIKQGTQDIRFFMVVSLARESINRQFQINNLDKQPYFQKVYSTTRSMDVVAALWDSKDNRTVWSVAKKLNPTSSNIVNVKLPGIKDDHPLLRGITFVADNPSEPKTLEFELRSRPARFPGIPDREPEFSKSFDDITLALPLHSSEEKLIEYDSFTYHRPELTVIGSAFGKSAAIGGAFNMTSMIYKTWRLGAGVSYLGSTGKYEDRNYNFTDLTFGVVAAAEFQLSDRFGLQIGGLIGPSAMTAKPELDQNRSSIQGVGKDLEPETSNTDGSMAYIPHLKLIYGNIQGGQFTLTGSYRRFNGIENPILLQNLPAPWSAQAGFAYTFRGF